MNDQPLILADENLSGVLQTFGQHRTVRQLAGRQIGRNDLIHADTLLVRSVTHVNAALLADTPVRFVGSATIGTDHLVLDELRDLGIEVVHAPGCNAKAVAEYVVTALVQQHPQWLQPECTDLRPVRLGIVGLGNVGSRLARLAQQLGWEVYGQDPWVQLEGVPSRPLPWLLGECDAVSLHVPLTRHGPHPTWHLLDAQRLCDWGDQTMLINTSRGPVIEEAALLEQLRRQPRPVVLDVFEHEPRLSPELLARVQWVTPHIAGYSLEGKWRGTQMIYAAWCAWQQQQGQQVIPVAMPGLPAVSTGHALRATDDLRGWLRQHLLQVYDLRRDNADLRACAGAEGVEPACFDRLRKQYPLRREWSAYGPAQRY